MKMVLFVSSEVGYEIAKHTLSRVSVPIVVLDSGDPYKDKIKLLSDKPIYIESTGLNKHYSLLKKENAEIFLLGWWPYILPKSIISLPTKACLNCHPSYLPFSRGRHYYFWNFVDEVPAGASIHIVDEKIDHGPICFQNTFETSWEDNAYSMVRKSRDCLVALYKEHLDEIRSLTFTQHPNDTKNGKIHFAKELLEKSKIDLKRTYKAKELLNIIRGCAGFPKNWAYFNDDGIEYEVSVEIRKKSDAE